MVILKRRSSYIWLIVLALFIASNLVLSTPSSSAKPENNWSANPTFHLRDKASSLAVTGLSPTQIRAAYNLPSTGGTGTIAIVDAYDDPTVVNDLNVFSNQFGLPLTSTGYFTEHKMSSSIKTNGGWALEISLDVQWAHAIAPSANILLVEASSSSDVDLIAAVDYARTQPGVVAVSMSWGGSEWATESSYDSHFTSSNGVVFFASSGDSGVGASWPAVSPNVVGVGGTTITFNGVGTLSSETAWSGSGGGVSRYIAEPSYQITYGVQGANGKRAVPDVSYNANPSSGVSVYDSTPYSGSTGWWVVGGTSAGSPQWAAIQSLGLTATNSNFYADAKSSGYSSYLRDITSGSNGYPAKVGYDLVTGLGSPLTTNYSPVVTPDFSISASPSALTINAGSAGSSTVTVNSLNSFSSAVTLTATYPVGWTVTLNPPSVIPTATSTLSITVPAGTSPGTYYVTATGTSGSLSHSSTLTVTVPTPAKPDFSISASPSALTIRSGTKGTSRITVSSINSFSGAVALAATYPNGWTVTFNPPSVTPPSGGTATSTLSITVPTSARSGKYTITVKGTSGSLTYSVTITVTVRTH